MSRSRTFLLGLVGSVLAGGIAGAGAAALLALAQGGDWLPGQATAVGACVAGAVGFAVAWPLAARGRREAGPMPSRAILEPAPEPYLAERVLPDEPDTGEPLLADEAGEPGPGEVTSPNASRRAGRLPADESDAPGGPGDLVAPGQPGPAEPVRSTASQRSPAGEPAQPGDGQPLAADAVRLFGRATTREAAIEEAGGLLVASGAVDPDYVAAMLDHERASSTHMGNALAVPRGSHAAGRFVHHSALAFVRYPEPVDWHGNRVRFVVAIAGVDNADQVRLVSRVAGVFLDDAVVARLEATGEVPEVLDAFDRAVG